MINSTNIYFASDFHLGVPSREKSLERENKLVRWLNSIASNATEIYLVGDIFDFWFEYKYVVPKGHVRLLGTLANLVDKGIKVSVFTGNHDMWMFDYLEQEIGVDLYKSPIQKTFQGKTFYIGHGDGLGPGDLQYKFLKRFFASKICQWMFARLHPNFSFGIAHFWSKRSRLSNLKKEDLFIAKQQEWLYQYCQAVLKKEKIDYFIFGHRHLPLDLEVEGTSSRYLNLGEWVTGDCHYAHFDGEQLSLKVWA